MIVIVSLPASPPATAALAAALLVALVAATLLIRRHRGEQPVLVLPADRTARPDRRSPLLRRQRSALRLSAEDLSAELFGERSSRMESIPGRSS